MSIQTLNKETCFLLEAEQKQTQAVLCSLSCSRMPVCLEESTEMARPLTKYSLVTFFRTMTKVNRCEISQRSRKDPIVNRKQMKIYKNQTWQAWQASQSSKTKDF